MKIVGPFPGGEYVAFVGGMTSFELTTTVRSSTEEIVLRKPTGEFQGDVLPPP